MGMQGIYHQTRVQELVQRFPEWRAERLPGSRAFQSTYDKFVASPTSELFLTSVSRVGTTICRWLFQTVHDTNAISAFDYILPLMVRKVLIYAIFEPSYPTTARTIPLH